MDLQHTFTVPAPIDQAWSTLLDVEGIAPCFPGATLTGVDGEQFAGTVKVKLGPVSLQYAGKGRFLEKDPATHTARIEAQGSDKRGNGTAGATVVARLEPAGESETRVVVDTALKITGRPAQFGRGVIQDVGGKIIDQFAACLAQRMVDAGPAAEQAGEAAAAGPAVDDPAATTPSANDPALATLQELGSAEGDVAAAATVDRGESADSAARAAASSSSTGAPAATSASTSAAAPTTAASTTAASTTAEAAPAAPPSRPAAPRAAPAEAVELDLNSVMLPALARRFGPALAALLAVLLVLLVARRRRR